jgi:hypothetical protein
MQKPKLTKQPKMQYNALVLNLIFSIFPVVGVKR